MITRIHGILFVSILIIGPIAWTQETDPATWHSLRDLTLRDETIGAIVSRVARMHEISIHIELSAKENDESEEIVLTLRQDEPIVKAIDRLLEAHPGIYMRERFENQLILRDAGGTNLLDSTISLELRDATPWEAVKNVGLLVNQQSETLKRLEIVLPNTDVLSSHWLPDSFTTARTVDLSLGNVSIRTALCQIFAQAPEVQTYMFHEWDEFYLLLIKSSGVMQQGSVAPEVAAEREAWWNREFQEIREAFEKSRD